MITLYKHQKKAVEQGIKILERFNILCLAMEVRTGKTITALTIARIWGAKSVLFITKKKAIGSIETDHELLEAPFNLTVINYESLHKVSFHHDFAIIDESHSLGAFPKPSQRAKNVRGYCYNLPIIMLSGTPSPESYAQLYHQFWVSKDSPWKRYKNFYRWADDYVIVKEFQINGRPIRKYNTTREDKIWGDIEKYFLQVSQKEADFSCDIIEQILYVEMSDMQEKIFLDLKSSEFVKHPYSDKIAIASNGADMVNKLAQVSGGTLIYDEDTEGEVISVTKAQFIVSRFAGQKIAILYKYKAEYEVLKRFFPQNTSDPELFNISDDLTFISQVQSAREGVNLSTADSLIFYNIDFSATSYFQARSRTQSKNRTKPCNVYYIFSKGGIEDKVFAAVTKKKNFTYKYYKNNR